MKFTEALHQNVNPIRGFMFEKCLKMDRPQVQLKHPQFYMKYLFLFLTKNFANVKILKITTVFKTQHMSQK